MQVVHEEAPAVLEYLPAGHPGQYHAPEEEYRPAMHAVQVDDPLFQLAVPAGQLVQLVHGVEENFPRPHGVHVGFGLGCGDVVGCGEIVGCGVGRGIGALLGSGLIVGDIVGAAEQTSHSVGQSQSHSTAPDPPS